ncbi:hypothetical protein CRM22_003205 [Opisthorchis felineus]|uniref:Secreted protein n=1 Tax=Opisthorchis felineus TaxID=147828 RepID=A0A4S2M2Y0_OPIFE|nr:hypothetical protein CRM22_003205 [Opisthorchis felineus]
MSRRGTRNTKTRRTRRVLSLLMMMMMMMMMTLTGQQNATCPPDLATVIHMANFNWTQNISQLCVELDRHHPDTWGATVGAHQRKASHSHALYVIKNTASIYLGQLGERLTDV